MKRGSRSEKVAARSSGPTRLLLASIFYLLSSSFCLPQAPSPFVTDLQRLPGDLNTRTNQPGALMRSNNILLWVPGFGQSGTNFWNVTNATYVTNVTYATNWFTNTFNLTNTYACTNYATNGIRYGALTPSYTGTVATLDIPLEGAGAWYYTVSLSNGPAVYLRHPTGAPGSAALKFLVAGSSQSNTLHMPTNWLWMQPWLLATSGTNYTATLTNGWGWLSLVQSTNTSSTNVAAKFYPP